MFGMDVLDPLVPSDGLLHIVIKNAVWIRICHTAVNKHDYQDTDYVCDGCVISPGSKWWFAAYGHEKMLCE